MGTVCSSVSAIKLSCALVLKIVKWERNDSDNEEECAVISEECYELGSKSSIIREIFSFGLKRKAQVGEIGRASCRERVFGLV